MLTKEQIEDWRTTMLDKFAHGDDSEAELEARDREINALCDLALSALSQPKDVKRPDYHGAWVEDSGQWVVKKIDYDALMDYATALEQPTAQGWRPISEAPKDGSNVWLSNGILVISGFWDGKGWFVGGDWGYLSDAGKHKRAPTHWHPDTKPQPPRSEVSNG